MRSSSMRAARAVTTRASAVCALAATTLLAGAWPAAGDPLPYRLPVTLPRTVSSPPMAADAPWTPTVKSLLHQLEPNQPDPEHDATIAPTTTIDQLINADKVLYLTGLNNIGPTGCTTVGYVDAPTGTTPSIPPTCWTDAQGVNVTTGKQVRQVTAQMTGPGMGSTWDPHATNAWGQAEGSEARWLGITGIYGPQVDLIRIPDWGRNSAVLSEDPFLGGTLGAGIVNGIQGKGAMSQVKHFAFYDGQNMDTDTHVQDQAAHQMFLQPYEYGSSGSGVLPHPGQASAMMCSYQTFDIEPAPGVGQGTPSSLSPSGGAFACNNQIKNVVARGMWGWKGYFGTDYLIDFAQPVVSIESGTDQDFTIPEQVSPQGTPLVAAVLAGVVPLSTFNTAVARVIYEDERFHMLGHDGANSNYLSPSNPIESKGIYALTSSMKARAGAIVEKDAEEGGVLLKDAGRVLPLTRRDLRRGVLIVGDTAEYMPADPGTETAAGYPDRDAISPLEQLRQFAPRGSKITFLPYMPGSTPSVSDGFPVPRSALSTDGGKAGTGIMRTAGPGSPRTDAQIDFTKSSRNGQLALGQTYTWHGFVNVPAADDFTFRFQFSVPSLGISSGTISTGQVNGSGYPTPPSCSGSGAPTFSLATQSGTGQQLQSESLSQSPNTIGVSNPPETDPTMSGYTERGLANCDYQAGTLSPGMHEIQISWTAPSAFSDPFHMREPGSTLPSFRFAYNRAAADRVAAITAARHAAKVIVFADCSCVNEFGGTAMNVNTLDTGPTQLINEMAAANRNTAVVTNFDVTTLMPWLPSVRGVLQMWYPGSEGGTATARLLLGQADPSGHLTQTWAANPDQTVFAWNEKTPLYPGDTPGVHSERLSGTTSISFDEGIFFGYRFFDRERITPQFPFGWGLSYTTFRARSLRVRRASGGLDVKFILTNAGKAPGTAVPQVYVGAARSVPAGVQQAVRALAGFTRVTLRPGRSRTITIHIGPGRARDGYGDVRAFQFWDTLHQRWATAPGPRRVWVGFADAPASLPLSTMATP
jgi:beta-glucosidase